MTDRLDDAAEERIREACPYHSHGDPLYQAQCWWCGLLRAAIIADREARPHMGIDWGKDEMQQERAHADRLAEALDGLIVGEPTCTPDDACFNECRANWSERLEVASAVLREHEERRR